MTSVVPKIIKTKSILYNCLSVRVGVGAFCKFAKIFYIFPKCVTVSKKTLINIYKYILYNIRCFNICAFGNFIKIYFFIMCQSIFIYLVVGAVGCECMCFLIN